MNKLTLTTLAVKNVKRDMWTYFAYFLSSFFSIFIFFSFSVSMFHPQLSKIQSGSALFLAMMSANILIYIFSFLFISYSVKSFMKSRLKMLANLVLMGASKKQMHKLIFTENFIIGILAIISAILMGILFSPISLIISKKIMNLEGFKMYFPIQAIIITLFLFIILFFLISFFAPFFLRKKQLMQLLKVENENKENKISKKLNMIIAFIETIFLIWQLVINKNDKSTIMFFINLVVFISFLYIMYNLITKFLVEKFTKTKFYLKGINLFCISDLKEKLSENVKIMFLITLLLNASFFSIILISGAQNNVENNVKDVYPHAITYISDSNYNDKIKKVEKLLGDEKGFKSFCFEIFIKEENERTAFLKESEFNKILLNENKNMISLKKNSGLNIISPKIKNEVKEGYNFYEGAKLKKIYKQITPYGYFSKIVVLKDGQINNMHSLKVFNFDFNDWKINQKKSKKAELILTDMGKNTVGCFNASDLYEVEKTSKNLMLYIGTMLSILFVLAAYSMIYFKLRTEQNNEIKKIKSLIKIGLSSKELKLWIKNSLNIILWVPFIVAVILLLISIIILSKNIGYKYFKIAPIMLALFTILQIFGSVFVKIFYYKSIKNSLKD